MSTTTPAVPYVAKNDKDGSNTSEKSTSSSREESIKRLKPHKNYTSVNEHVKAMRHMYETGEFSDITLRSEYGTVFKVHKIVICGQSKFFKKACHPDHFKEGVENHINLEFGDSSILAILIEYLYVLDYDDRALEPEQGPLLTNSEIYAAADFYDIPSLKKLAQVKMKKCVSSLWEHQEFPQAVRVVYTSTLPKDRGLRDIVLKAILENFEDLGETVDETEHGILEDRPTFTQVMSEVADVSRDIALQFSQKWMKFRQVKCECGHIWAYSTKSEQLHMACPHCAAVRSDWATRRAD